MCAVRQVINRIQVAPRPVHMFAVPETLQVWAHSDAEGTFDVISIDETDRTSATVAVRPPGADHNCPFAATGRWTPGDTPLMAPS